MSCLSTRYGRSGKAISGEKWADVCRRWCVMPIDRMSKAILVATANPYNQQAAKELSEATTHRLLWYLAPPNDLLINLRKAFR